ncbi:MAG: protein kinase [Actinomycetota bacterium]
MTSPNDVLAERYLLEEPVAHGGMATVWKARDEVLARPVAVKILHPHLSEDRVFIDRFRREAIAAARLSHPNIVAIYDTGQHPGDAGGESQYIVMEYLSGGTLAALVAAQGALDPDRVVTMGTAVCAALAYAHGGGVIHRDVKPGNVLLAHDETLKVGDFGIAKAAFDKGDITTTGAILGTVTYLSPEQARGDEPDARSDLYSLGVTLYELAVGRPPFAEETPLATAMKHLSEPPPAPRSIKPGVPRAVEAVLMRALEKDPAARYPSAEEMGQALARAGSGSAAARSFAAGAPPRSAPAVRSGSFLSEYRWLFPVLALVGLALVGVLLIPPDDLPARLGGEGNGRGGGGTPLEVRAVDDFDPHGDDGEEHSSEAPLAADGDPDSAWNTSSYSFGNGGLGKPGVGLIFDLGSARAVGRVDVSTPEPGMTFEVRAADERGLTETDFELVVRPEPGEDAVVFEERSARYWLIWITRLPGSRASIAEVSFRAP